MGQKQKLQATVLLLALASGCGLQNKNKRFEGIACGAADQHQSYMNPMDSTVVQTISVDARFTTQEKNQIESMVEAWNAEGRRSIGRDLFSVRIFSLSANSVPEPTRDCGFPGTPHGFSIVRVDSQETWKALGFEDKNPGVTIRCAAGSEYAQKQVVLINPNNMKPYAKFFENVVLHELGHSIGLDHSCDPTNSGQPGFAGCNTVSQSGHDYGRAVMYPYVLTSNLKDELRSNDQERATCALGYRPE